MESLESGIRKALQGRMEEIINEEVEAAKERIRQRITADSVQLGIEVIKRLSWDQSGEIAIKIRPNL